MKAYIWLTSLSLVISTLGCQSSEFARSSDKRKVESAVPKIPDPIGEPVSYALGCDLKDPLSVDLKGSIHSLVKVTGDFCPHAYGNLSLLLAVDFSGSMQLSDPSKDGTCGRLQAAQKIVEKITADMHTGDNIKMGLVRFATTASITSPLIPIDQFAAGSLTYANFCNAENAATNYQAAFETTAQALQGAGGYKSVFLISDGLPTIPGDGTRTTAASQQAGLTAAQNLLRDIKDTTVNAVFLKGNTATDASPYLAQLTGDSSRVKIADAANDLADKIVELSIPSAALDETSIAAQLTAGANTRVVKIAKIAKDANRPNVWNFESEAFAPLGTAGTASENLVTVTAKDAAGSDYKVVLKLNFTSTP